MMADSTRYRTAFIAGRGIDDKIKNLLRPARKIRIAVAYWGAGATKRLGLGSLASRDVIVVCGLKSGACNPNEIICIQNKLGKKKVRNRDHLHAKVWLTEKGAIIGSSNASANGLGLEGDELQGQVEANVFINDPGTLAAIENWFHQQVMTRAEEITKAELKKACCAWKRRRINLPLLLTQKSLLDSVRANPISFAERAFVMIYSQRGLDGWADRVRAEVQEERRHDSIGAWQVDVRRVLPPGAYVLDFELKKDRTTRLDGLYRVLMDDPIRRTRHGTVLLGKRVRNFESVPLGEKQAWGNAATTAARTKPSSNDMRWKMEDFARFLPEPPRTRRTRLR